MWPAEKDYYTSREKQIKAAFIYNFTKFIEWPESAFAAGADHFIIGNYGDPAFFEYLVQLEGEKINGRSIKIIQYNSLTEIKNVQVVFIQSTRQAELKAVLDQLHPMPILTIGENERFLRSGGTINFIVHKNRVGFEINIKSAQNANLTFSSKLLNLATNLKTW